MISVLLPVLFLIYDSLRSRVTLQAEVLALRHQILVLQRGNQKRRVKVSPADRLFWVWLSRLWPGWRSALASFCRKTVKRAVVAGENAQSRQPGFRWRRTAPAPKIIYMRPESLLDRRAGIRPAWQDSKMCLRNPEKLGCSLVGAVPTSLCLSQQSSQAEQIVGQHRCSH